MLKKFLAFFRRESVDIKNGMAQLELSEEEMEAAGTIISERDDAVANVERLTAELETANSLNAELTTQVETANTLTASVTEENTSLKAEVATLKPLPATETTAAVTDKNKEVSGETNPNVSKGEDFLADMNAVKESYL